MRKLITLLAVLAITAASYTTIADDMVFNEVDTANQAFAKAVLNGDIDVLVSSYTVDACIIAPATPLTCGAQKIRAFWTAVIGSKPNNVVIETIDVGSEGSLAHAHGRLLITDAKGSLHENKFVLVLKNVSGEWKLHLDTWTPN